MTVAELIAELQDAPEDAEVRLAHQPQWPFEYSIETVAVADSGEVYEFLQEPGVERGAWQVVDRANGEVLEDGLPTEEACERWVENETGEAESIVYIGEGSQIGYLPGIARAALGWS